MSTDNATILFDSSTDAAFRAWGLRISQALATCGLVQTADTGQINWTTITRNASYAVSGSEVITGYEVWRFNDTLQATKPVFIKLEYGMTVDQQISGSLFAVGNPVIYVTVGTATNSAGTLTGVLTSSRTRLLGGGAYQINGGSATSHTGITVSSPCYFSGDGSYINVALGVTAQAQPSYTNYNTQVHSVSLPAMLGIERSRNTDGTTNGNGVMLMTVKWPTIVGSTANTVAPTYQVVSFLGGAYTVSGQDGYIPFAYAGSGFGTAQFSGDIYFAPLPVSTPRYEAQALCFLGTWKNDVPLASPITLPVLGSNHTYLSLAGIAGPTAADNSRSYFWSGITNGAMMMRYE